jgi:ribonuclease VapC
VIVLDSSALLAIILREPGAARVQAAIPVSILSSANLAEVLTVCERKGLNSEQIYSDITILGLPVVPLDAAHARVAAQLWRAYPRLNLSLGDRLCLALALNLGASVLTSDREMTKVGLGVSVELFR